MIAGFCFNCNTVQKIFRKFDKYCSQCGSKLVVVEATLAPDKKTLQTRTLEQ